MKKFNTEKFKTTNKKHYVAGKNDVTLVFSIQEDNDKPEKKPSLSKIRSSKTDLSKKSSKSDVNRQSSGSKIKGVLPKKLSKGSKADLLDEEELTPEKSAQQHLEKSSKDKKIKISETESIFNDCGCNQILLPFPYFEDPEMLPLVAPREHGRGCHFELAVLEKHDPICAHRKFDNADRNPIDDNLGSFQVIGRVAWPYCMHGCGIKSSEKGANLHCPFMSEENFRDIPSGPILPPCESCVGGPVEKPSYAPSFHFGGCCDSGSSMSCCNPVVHVVEKETYCCDDDSSQDCCGPFLFQDESAITMRNSGSRPLLANIPSTFDDYPCCPPRDGRSHEVSDKPSVQKIFPKASDKSMASSFASDKSVVATDSSPDYSCCPPDFRSQYVEMLKINSSNMSNSAPNGDDRRRVVSTAFNHEEYRERLLKKAAAKGIGISRKTCTCKKKMKKTASQVFQLPILDYLQGYSEEKRKQLSGLRDIINLTKPATDVSKSNKNFPTNSK